MSSRLQGAPARIQTNRPGSVDWLLSLLSKQVTAQQRLWDSSSKAVYRLLHKINTQEDFAGIIGMSAALPLNPHF